jgi:TPR repeat protein
MKWFRLAAKQGHAFAQNSLGAMFHGGHGVAQDYAEAMKWFRLAAEQGHADAQYNLGAMYANGQGTPQDYVQALVWFSLAASALSDATQNRDLIASKMTSQQLAEAQRLISEWTPK